MEMQTSIQSTLVDTAGEERGDKLRVALKCVHDHMENTQLVGRCCITRGAETGAQRQPNGVGARFRGRGRMYTYG